MTNPLIDENKEKERNLFGKLIRFPLEIFYLLFSVILGSAIGTLCFLVMPWLIPFQMIKARYFPDGSTTET